MRAIRQFTRNFNRQKVVGLLNISSLALGVMVSVVVGLWAMNELSFDTFHRDHDRMYRMVQQIEMNGRTMKIPTAFAPQGALAADKIPEIEDFCRVVVEDLGLTIRGRIAPNVRTLKADDNFFDFFTFPLVEGDAAAIFSGPVNAIVTESAADRYFPGEDPVGQSISVHGFDMTIAGVMRDFPRNSHIRADFVLPMYGWFATWGWESSCNYDTYFRLRPGADVAAVEAKLGVETIPTGLENIVKDDAESGIFLERITDVHFTDADLEFDSAVRGNRGILRTFIFTALIILIISCINFTNLFVSTSFLRAKAIGVKKSFGATKFSLTRDFYIETLCYVAVSVVAGLALAHLTFPVFNGFVGSDTALDFTDPRLYLFLAALIVVVVAMAGSFPALYMTRFGIIETLRGRFRGRRASWFQKGLMTVQFTASIFLLIVVMFFGRQIDTMLGQDLGFDKENVIYVNGSGSFGTDLDNFRDQMTRHPSISDVAMLQYQLPMYMGYAASAERTDGARSMMTDVVQVSDNYFDFFDMQFVWGENPLPLETARAELLCVVNERFMKMLELDYGASASRPEFIFRFIGGGGGSDSGETDGRTYRIAGVIRDSYVKSLHEAPGPQIYVNLGREDYNPVLFKVAGDPQEALRGIEERWAEVNPDIPFEAGFLDDAYDRLYREEADSRNVLGYAMIITVLITIAGLFAMNYYMTQRRVKEIGIRKINGATLGDLLLLLNRGILWQVAISFALAAAVSWLFLRGWLKGFIVQTSLSGWVFALAGLATCLLALATVSWQTLKTATANPVDSLRSE